jgi:hypothetical protein
MPFAELRRLLKSPLDLPQSEQIKLALMGIVVVFAALGLGEAVYRVLFSEFEGATDRLPIETMFGIAFAFMLTKFFIKVHRRRVETHATLELIRKRNEKIRAAVTSIAPLPVPGQQQAIRVIREEVDSIRWNLSDIIPE